MGCGHNVLRFSRTFLSLLLLIFIELPPPRYIIFRDEELLGVLKD